MKKQKDNSSKKKQPHTPLKPQHPDTAGAPDDRDPQAQYENKDES